MDETITAEDILGVWYTNNDINPAILRTSLNSLNLNVVCAVWEPIPGNPHPELIQNQPLRSHFGIALQIARVLWDVDPAKGVCFLEHDVMYPQDYFARVAYALNKAPAAFNHDYIGLNETGWLETTSRGEPPMHQLSMRWDYALDWINWRVRQCVCNPKQGLEPEDKSLFWIMPIMGRPAVHINHKEHFTTHYMCYDRQGKRYHPYWGDAKSYYPDGEHDAR